MRCSPKSSFQYLSCRFIQAGYTRSIEPIRHFVCQSNLFQIWHCSPNMENSGCFQSGNRDFSLISAWCQLREALIARSKAQLYSWNEMEDSQVLKNKNLQTAEDRTSMADPKSSHAGPQNPPFHTSRYAAQRYVFMIKSLSNTPQLKEKLRLLHP